MNAGLQIPDQGPISAQMVLCNCKRTIFGVQIFLVLSLHLRSHINLAGQTGSGQASDLGQNDWVHCVFSSGDILTMRLVVSPLALPNSPTHWQLSMMLQQFSWVSFSINHTSQTLGLGKRQDFIKITSDWFFGSDKGGMSHLHNLVSLLSLKVTYGASKSKCIKV